MQIPIFESQIACGFPSPAQDHIERRLSLDAELIRYPERGLLQIITLCICSLSVCRVFHAKMVS
ncbi:hypothetical protein ABN228_20560, partial [Providencia rettgeri]